MKKDEKKAVKKTTSKKVTKKNKENYFKGVNKELKLVKWPEGKEVVKYTISTVVFVAILCLLFILLTYILAVITGKGWF